MASAIAARPLMNTVKLKQLELLSIEQKIRSIRKKNQVTIYFTQQKNQFQNYIVSN